MLPHGRRFLKDADQQTDVERVWQQQTLTGLFDHGCQPFLMACPAAWVITDHSGARLFKAELARPGAIRPW